MGKMVQEYRVNNLHESILASGLPMSKILQLDLSNPFASKADMKRAKKLGKVKTGTGHDCYLKGINVFMIITAPEYWWKQFERYSFQDTVSSTSTMHKLLDMPLCEVLPKDIYPEVATKLHYDIEAYKYWEKENEERAKNIWKRIIANLPMGFKYTRAITTNYLQLKTIYFQRKHHKLDEWKEFCSEIEKLPLFKELVIKKD